MRVALLFGLFALFACSSPQTEKRPKAKRKILIHTGYKWFEYRGGNLGMTRSQAQKRDAAITEAGPPKDRFWDEQLAVEAASVWRALCNECHGGRRSIEDAKQIPTPSADWGTSEGNFFGRTKQHAEMFRVVAKGGQPKDGKESEMPGWESKISNEQIWALVYYIEHNSGDVFLTPEEVKKHQSEM